MARSYLYLKNEQVPFLLDMNLKKCDCMIVTLDAFLEISLQDDVITYLKEEKIQVYVSLDSGDLKESFFKLKNRNVEILKGFALHEASKKALNFMTLKLREFEQLHKLPFGMLGILAYIEDAKGIIDAVKIGKYSRVIGLVYKDTTQNDLFLKDILLASFVSNKDFIYSSSDPRLETEEFYEARLLGLDGIVSSDIRQVGYIKDAYKASKEDLAEAVEIVEKVQNSTTKDRKKLFINNKRITASITRKALLVLENEGVLEEVVKKNIRFAHDTIIVSDQLQTEVKKFYTFGEEIGNAVTHGVGIVLGLVSLILLAFKGLELDSLALVSYLVFAGSAILLYTMSTLYHALPLGSKAKQVFQKLDHMTIYALIAGTYTPFTLLVIGGTLGSILCIVLWVSALFGMLLNLFFFKRFRLLHMSLYVIMGWVAVFFIPQIVANLSTMGIVLLFVGGLMYTLGIIFYALKLFKFTHMVWHFFVFFGTLFHFFAILFYV